MTFRHHAHIILFTLLLQISLFSSQRADYKVPENQLNRRFSWSTNAPLAEAINDLTPDAIPYADLIIRHATRVEKAVLESLKRPRLVPEAVIQPCNPQVTRRYRRSIWRAFALRGLLEPAWNCGSDVRGVRMSHEEEPGYTLEDLYKALFNQGAVIKRRVNEIARRVIDNFTRPEIVFNHTYRTVSASCVFNLACMFREGEYWRQDFGLDSYQKDVYVSDGSRQSIKEHLRVVDGRLGDPLLLRLPVYDNGSVERVILENTTTFIQSWRGALNPSCFLVIPITENPALIEALDLTDHSSQLVEDALTSSNLAILLLPLALNLVPVALFADVSTVTLLLYTMMSDVLTVIPLAIKGVELVLIERQKFRSVVTRILSPALGNGTIPHASGGEVWGAECRVRDGVGRSGIILIVTSLVFLLIGIGGEFVARKYSKALQKMLAEQKGKSDLSEQVSLVSKTLSGGTSLASPYESGKPTLDCELGAGGVAARYSSDFEWVPKSRA